MYVQHVRLRIIPRGICAGDNIVVIKDGKVAEQGTHSELLKIQIKKKKDEGDLLSLTSC
eukprot:SAG31_NODE_391_length_16344_cov_15.753339_13_plen_59_part_00